MVSWIIDDVPIKINHQDRESTVANCAPNFITTVCGGIDLDATHSGSG